MMLLPQDPQPRPALVLGVDTHADTHTAALLDHYGALLSTAVVPATPSGYRDLLAWASTFGQVLAAGVEGTGSYGSGLARFLASRGVPVSEVERPKRKHRTRGKSDAIDAELAARAIFSRVPPLLPKSHDGFSEMLRVLVVARRSAVKSRTQAANQLRSLLVTAPDGLRSSLSPLRLQQLVSRCSRLRPGSSPSDVSGVTRLALRSVARRYQLLTAEISELDAHILRIVSESSPQLLALVGVGPDVAAALLITAGDNPCRLRSEASFAALCGVAPIPASSGKTNRHRLNRSGDRQANRALHVIAMARMSCCERTRLYVARRTSEGKSKKEIIRCLKRYIAREIYRTLEKSQQIP